MDAARAGRGGAGPRRSSPRRWTCWRRRWSCTGRASRCTARPGRTSSSARCVCGWATCRARSRELRDGAGRCTAAPTTSRGEAWALTQLARARLVDGDPAAAVDELRQAAVPAPRQRGRARARRGRCTTWARRWRSAATATRRCASWSGPARCSRRMRDVYGLACARHHSGRVTRDQRAAQTGNLRNSGFARQLLVDARADFHRIGVAHGEAWTCLELAVIDAGNDRAAQALALCDEAARAVRVVRGPPRRRLGPFPALHAAAVRLAGRLEVGTAVAQEELAELLRRPRTRPRGRQAGGLRGGVRAGAGARCAAWRTAGRPGSWAWCPSRHAREVMGVPVAAAT